MVKKAGINAGFLVGGLLISSRRDYS